MNDIGIFHSQSFLGKKEFQIRLERKGEALTISYPFDVTNLRSPEDVYLLLQRVSEEINKVISTNQQPCNENEN